MFRWESHGKRVRERMVHFLDLRRSENIVVGLEGRVEVMSKYIGFI